MANVLVRDVSPELEAFLQDYAQSRGLTVSQAAIVLLQQSFESEAHDVTSGAGVRTSDFLSETLKEVLHTKDEAEEFIRSHESVSEKPRII
jgi:hypothetical protein